MKDLRAAIFMVQRLGVVTFVEDATEREVEVYTRHLRHAWEELRTKPPDVRSDVHECGLECSDTIAEYPPERGGVPGE